MMNTSKSITVGHWIRGVIDGRDLLQAEEINEFVRGKGVDPRRDDKSTKIFTRGHANASNLEGNQKGLESSPKPGIEPLGGEGTEH